MAHTTALSPHLGVRVTGVAGVEDLLDDAVVSRCLEALKWRGATDDIPVKATTLTARHVAMTGGQTEFASTYAAYENLPEADRKRYDGLRVHHSFEASQRYEASSQRTLHRTTIYGDEAWS